MKGRALVVACAIAMAACAQRATVPGLVDAQQASKSPAAVTARKLAPQAVDEADAFLKLANQAREDNDDVGAALYAERAIAGYQRALMLARVARATTDLASATTDGDKADAERKTLIAQRADADRQGDELEKKLFLARELRSPSNSGPADPQREAARLSAAKSLALGAHLLCGAARLVDSQTDGLKTQEDKLAELDKKLDADGTSAATLGRGPHQDAKPAPIDDAARARADCLSLLTKARRAHPIASGGGQSADPLLSELSAAGSEPMRDERGIVVTLRDVFAGSALSKDGQAKLESLGRVAAAHPNAPVQVVIHDATTQPPGQRAQLVTAAVVKGGAKPDKIAGEIGGTRAPVVDPNDAHNRGRNARVDIVFITTD